MGVLVWWLLPLLATLAAITWLWWQARTGAGEPGQTRSMKELDRMRKAMGKPLPQVNESPAESSAEVAAEVDPESKSGAP